MTYWINTVSADHVQRGVAGGFTQANHGKPDMLRRMSRDDWVIFYSPKTAFENGEPLQAFTAIGRIIDDEPYQAQVSPKFHPWRRKYDVSAVHGDTHPATAEPAAVHRRSTAVGLQVPVRGVPHRAGDFDLIRSAMTQPLAA